MKKRRPLEIISGKTNADSSLAWASEDSVVSGRTPGTSAGDVTVWLPTGFRPISVVATNAAGNARAIGIIMSYSTTGQWTFRLLHYNLSAALIDEAMFFTVTGYRQ